MGSGLFSTANTTVRWLVAIIVGLVVMKAADASAEDSSAVYRFTRPTPIHRCTIDGNPWSAPAAALPAPAPPVGPNPRRKDAIAQPNWKFYPIKEAKGQVVLQFLHWKRKKLPAKSTMYHLFNVAEEGSHFETILWCMTKADPLPAVADQNLGRFDMGFGAMVIPIKLRLGTTNQRATAFTTDVTLAGAADMNWGIRDSAVWRMHVPVFAGVSAINIGPKESNLAEARDVPALSLGLGFGVSGKSAAAGVVVGWDIINPTNIAQDNKRLKWDYQGRAWIGISIGATFGVTTPKPEKTQD